MRIQNKNQGFTLTPKFGVTRRWRGGFTIIELIIYMAIVSIILVSITYLILDIIGGQTKSYAGQEINQNIRFITNNLIKDIESASDIGSLSADTLELVTSGGNIIYYFDSGNKKLTRQVDLQPPIEWHSDEIEVVGSFFDFSYLERSKNVGVELNLNYKNPGNLPDYNASTTINFSVQLKGRR